MTEPDFDLSEWNFLPPLDDAALPIDPPSQYPVGLTVSFDDWDIAELDVAERIDALVELDRQLGAIEAQKQQLLAFIADRDSSSKHWSVEEVGAALRLSGGAARALLAGAQQLVHRLPGTHDALRSGRISAGHVAAIVRGSYALPDELLSALEARVLPRAGEQSVPGVRQSVARAVLALDPLTAEQKHERARTDRSVRINPADDGMAWLMALLPAADAQAIFTKLDAAARRAPADDLRTMAQLRADALVDGVLAGVDGEMPHQHGRQPQIEVLIGLTTLIGQDDEPAWLTGYGPVNAEQARRLAHDPSGTWRRLLTDPVSGELVDYGRTRYRPPPHLADHVIARDGHCSFPFCTHAARTSDLDHVIPFPDGPTNAANLQSLHRRHHNAKTEGGWSAVRDDQTGATDWTSPAGRHYRSRPPERWTAPDDPAF